MRYFREIIRLIAIVVMAVVLSSIGVLSLAAEPQTTNSTTDPVEIDSLAGAPLPPEIQELIGMIIPTVMRVEPWYNNKTRKLETREVLHSGDIPNFFKEDGGAEPVEFGFINRIPVLVVVKIRPNREREIVNIAVIPSKLLNVYFEDGKAKHRPNGYAFFEPCDFRASANLANKYSGVRALAKSESGKSEIAHTTRRIRMAWGIVRDTMRLELVDPKTVECFNMAADIGD